ncbi:MAG: hypothetical protein M3017_10795 [Actinomycetota bacterium]|nr:hypothetical protein [Actinomycetota bacterium]
MLKAPAGPSRTECRGRRAAIAAAVLASALLLAGCGAGTSGGGSGTTGAGSPSASAPPSSGPSASPAQAGQHPSASATVGALVPGFPSTLVPLMSGATVQSSSLDKSKPLVTASLVASTAAKSEDILAFYTKALQDQGFTALPGDAVGSVASKDFTRANGQETVNLAVVPSGATATFTIGANVLPASLK